MLALLLSLKRYGPLYLLIQTLVEVVRYFNLHFFAHALPHYICEHLRPLLALIELNLHLNRHFREISSLVDLCCPLAIIKQLLGAWMRFGVASVEGGVFRHANFECRLVR